MKNFYQFIGYISVSVSFSKLCCGNKCHISLVYNNQCLFLVHPTPRIGCSSLHIIFLLGPSWVLSGPSDPTGIPGGRGENLWWKHTVVLKAPARKCHDSTPAHRSLAKVSHVASPDVSGTESIILL